MTANNFPKISIVTPSFNQAQFIESTIESILNQKYPNLEYIIIDGGSTDGSVEIIKKYQEHLHYWCSEPDAGQYDAINKGFQHSTGEIMAWLNSDDLYFPWALKTVASIMSQLKEVEWLSTLQPGGCDWEGCCTGFGSFPGYSKQAFLDGRYAIAGFYMQQESTFWRRSLWQKSGSQILTEFKLAGDFALWSKFFCHGELYAINSPLGCFRSQVNQKSRSIEQYAKEANSALSTMRESCNWQPSPNAFKAFLWQRKVHRIPRISKLITAIFGGYQGRKIVKYSFDSPDSYWAIQTYKF
jgi:glycosyltransferase involved in cell wall biosynthesis